MKHFIFLIVLTVASAHSKSQVNLHYISLGSESFMNYSNNSFTLNQTAEFTDMENRFTYKNLRIYMLKANNAYMNANRGIGNYTSLQEAIKTGKIRISELNGGTVNTLEFENISKDTVMILAGEIVTGGKQDRVIGKDFILPPHSGKVNVPVFCVEHGRWTPQSTGNQFSGYYGISDGSVRKKAVVNKNQNEVWQKVADMNKKNHTESSTGTYSSLQHSEMLKKELPAYLGHFESLIAGDSNYIGFVAVTGDTIISADLFATNKLFRKQAPQLLRSAAVEAITNGTAVAIAGSKVMEFLCEFLRDESTQEEKVMQNGTMLKKDGKKVHLNYYKK